LGERTFARNREFTKRKGISIQTSAFVEDKDAGGGTTPATN